MGATNRPQDLDSAILRRMPTRFHINQPVHTHTYTLYIFSLNTQGCVCVHHVSDVCMCVQSVRQRQQILRLILENENVSLHRHTHRWISGSWSRWSADRSQYCLPLCRLTCLLISWILPKKQMVSQEVISERCVAMLRCCVCVTLSTCRVTGTSLTDASVWAGRWLPQWKLRSNITLRQFMSLSLSSPSEDYIRPIGQSDLQKSISKMKKSKLMGGANALLHAALDWRRVMWLFFFIYVPLCAVYFIQLISWYCLCQTKAALQFRKSLIEKDGGGAKICHVPAMPSK